MTARIPVSRFHWTTPLDNYASPRSQTHGVGEVYKADETQAETVTLASSDFPFRRNIIFLLDDGVTVRPFYVAGLGLGQVHVQPFPTGDSHRAWVLGPHLAYHLKIQSYD